MTVYGSGHLAGQLVQLSVCGVYCGLFTVAADGSVVFTFGADPGGIVTPSYLVAHLSEGTDHDVSFQVFDGTTVQTVVVPVLVGLAYTAQGQLIRPTAEASLGAGPGAGLGKTRRAVWGAFLVRDLLALQVGTNFSNMFDVTISTDGMGSLELLNAADAPYSGVITSPIDDIYGYDSALAWQSNKPYNLVIGAAELFLEGAAR
jgi:hypothetical protein